MKKLSAIVLFLCVSANSLFAQTLFSPEVKRVAVFKNGYAFTYREGETQTSDGWAYTTNLPVGVLGTVWGYSTSPNVKVMSLLASESEKRETERVTNISEILLANEGARIRFTDTYNTTKYYEGTYEILSPNRNFAVPRVPVDQYQQQPELVISLKTETGTMLFPVNSIRNIEFLNQPKMEKPKSSKENRLALKVDGTKDGDKINLGVAALERGIRWIPAYRVEFKGTPVKEAKLELEAAMINELTDLTNSEVYFVVGVPHFLFQEQMSPLSMNTAFAGVSSYFRAGSDRGRRDAYSNALASQSYQIDGADDSSSREVSPTVSEEEKTNTFSAEQLFLYQANQVNLKKGQRASFRLFSLTVPASEVFEWTLNDAPETQRKYLEYSNSTNSIPLMQDLSSKVWYALKLKNQTGMPWTTAPALSFREWKPLGQDMLSFTPVGGENILRVTPATEVIGTHTLEEKTREQKTLRYGGGDYTFDLVTVEGKIKLKNIKKEPVEIVLTRNFVGEAVSAGDNGKISREGLNLQAVNPNSVIKWNLTIPSGEKEIVYTYKIYVRR
ncbi:MAG TPA: hypothetical protein PKY59_21930 [Pyrinomonadaceae bacterium]|nr:hypothetical protein [Pyrinomonadaceae bacterium]